MKPLRLEPGRLEFYRTLKLTTAPFPTCKFTQLELSKSSASKLQGRLEVFTQSRCGWVSGLPRTRVMSRNPPAGSVLLTSWDRYQRDRHETHPLCQTVLSLCTQMQPQAGAQQD